MPYRPDRDPFRILLGKARVALLRAGPETELGLHAWTASDPRRWMAFPDFSAELREDGISLLTAQLQPALAGLCVYVAVRIRLPARPPRESHDRATQELPEADAKLLQGAPLSSR